MFLFVEYKESPTPFLPQHALGVLFTSHSQTFNPKLHHNALKAYEHMAQIHMFRYVKHSKEI